jgi:hypothetical protein
MAIQKKVQRAPTTIAQFGRLPKMAAVAADKHTLTSASEIPG